ncbi:hypothetical protein ES708_14492 [subsurface metagenome]
MEKGKKGKKIIQERLRVGSYKGYSVTTSHNKTYVK